MYGFLSSDFWFYPHTYYTCLAILVSAAVICFVLSYVAWRRQHHPPMQSTGAAGAFPVIRISPSTRSLRGRMRGHSSIPRLRGGAYGSVKSWNHDRTSPTGPI